MRIISAQEIFEAACLNAFSRATMWQGSLLSEELIFHGHGLIALGNLKRRRGGLERAILRQMKEKGGHA